MKLTADHTGNTRHFSAKLGWRERFDPKEIEILTAHAIPMLIPPESVQGRRNNILQYDISAYSSLEYYLTFILSREQFADLLLQCIDVFQRMQKIYLNYKNLVLELDKIFIQLSDRTIHFIYLPLMSSKREASQPEFFRMLIKKAARSTYEQSAFLDACIIWLDRPAPFVLSEFGHFIKEYACVGAATEASWSRESTEGRCFAPRPERFVPPEPKKPFEQSRGQNDTSRLDEPSDGGTVLLGGPEPSVPTIRYYIQRLQPEEKIELTHFPFLVGTELGSVSYCVTGNAAVSRRHAEFTIRDGNCVIVDQKSTNKTYINDCAVAPFTPHQLKSGDIIRLGNEKFKFIREERA